ncbi:restriction endonuclease [Selenomonas ruminantium]|uniref:restriction endonuclease n=1 Tax=Selenomonas ruminantium TaxID=971 RepID=UPI00068D893B|nr:restriction endonuclease [Selenomonas ruminantium]
MEPILVIVVLVFLYIFHLRFKVSHLREEVKKISDEKQYELISKVNDNIRMKNEEFEDKVNGFVKKVNELQKEIKILLNKKHEDHGIRRKSLRGDLLEDAIDYIISEQKNINETYKIWIDKINNESNTKKREIEDKEREFSNKKQEILDEIESYSQKRRKIFTRRVNEIIQIIKELQDKTYLITGEKYEESSVSYVSGEGDVLEKALKELVNGQKNINDEYKKIQEKVTMQKELLSKKIIEFPFLTTVLADYDTAKEKAAIEYLTYKRQSAPKTAKIVEEIKQEKKKCLEELYAYRWELAYLHNLLPWLGEMEREPVSSPVVYNDENNKDSVANWVSPKEYKELSEIDRNQLALDRYMKRKKTKWQIGMEYERYIGYRYEKKGYKVKYFGIEEGLEDLGRDLICYRENDIHVVQCKCWSAKKEIHEKHINQLFGTTVMYYFSEINPKGSFSEFYNYIKNGHLIPVFVTTTSFSPTARKFAKSLKVLALTVPLDDYPMIKCNINRTTGEKIYHLPFDQQYDKCVIDQSEGEFYAKTVKEAEANGFRRAMRWHGN